MHSVARLKWRRGGGDRSVHLACWALGHRVVGDRLLEPLFASLYNTHVAVFNVLEQGVLFFYWGFSHEGRGQNRGYMAG